MSLFGSYAGGETKDDRGTSAAKYRQIRNAVPVGLALALGKAFRTELTGDAEFYIKLIRFTNKLPEKYVEEFDMGE